MLRPAKQLVGQWAGYDAPLLNQALEVVAAHDPDLQLTPLATGLQAVVVGPATPAMPAVLQMLPKTGVVIAPAHRIPATHATVLPYQLIRYVAFHDGGFTAYGRVGNQDVEVSLPHVHRPTHIYAALAALALAHYRDVSLAPISHDLAELTPAPGYGSLHAGINSSQVMNESLQATLEDMHDCVAVLKARLAERKIAILGSYPQVVHRAGQAAHLVVLVGKHMRLAEQEAFLAGADVHCFDTAEEVAPWLTSFIQPGDLILIKGRKEAGLERVVEKLTV